MAAWHLRTFGGLALVDDGGSPALPQSAQRRLVLLALAVEAAPRGLPRDRAVSWLWPEADDEHGRRSLNQLRYTLRRELGADPLAGTLTLRPDAAVLTSDLERFRAAVAAGDVETALSLHTAPFLDAVPLGGAPELDEWAEACRHESGRQLTRLLERAAHDASRRDDVRTAEALWRKLVQLEPLSAPHAVGLMESLAASGNASGALVVAAQHEDTVRRELGVAPDASVKAAASRIRARTQPGAARPTPQAMPVAGFRSPVASVRVPGESGTSGVSAVPQQPRPPDVTVSRPPSRFRRIAWIVATVLIAAAVGAVAAWRGRHREPAASASTIAVLPFTVYGGDEYQYLREGMVTLLSARLEGESVVRPADGHAVVSLAHRSDRPMSDPARAAELARELGVGSYVVGEVVEAGGRLRLQASAYRMGRTAPLARAGVEGPPAELFSLVDSLAARLLTGLTEMPGPRSRPLAAGTTSSLAALKAYLEGEQLFRRGDAPGAFDAFARAATTDTTFALANYWASVAAWWADQSDTVLTHADLALRHAERVGSRDRPLLVAWDTLVHGDPIEAERIYRTLLGAEPDNVAAWEQLGEVLFHYSPRRGLPIGAARPAFERVLLYEPGNPGVLLHLARIAGSERNFPLLDSIARQFDNTDSLAEWRVELDAVRAAARRDSAGLARAARALASAPDARIWSVALHGWRATFDGPATRELLLPLVSDTRAPETRAMGHVGLAWLAMAQDHLAEARAELAEAAALDSVTAMEHEALLLLLPFVPATAAELAAMRVRLERWDPERSPQRLGAGHVGGVHDDAHHVLRNYLIGSLSARLGDARTAQRHAALLDRTNGPVDLVRYARAAAQSVRAQVAIAEGRNQDAVDLLSRSLTLETRITRATASPFYLRGLERFLLAEQLGQVGRTREAERWYGSFRSSFFDTVFETPAMERLAALSRASAPPQRAADST